MAASQLALALTQTVLMVDTYSTRGTGVTETSDDTDGTNGNVSVGITDAADSGWY